MILLELLAKMAICRRCDSEVQWHLNPFSSRHCFWHIWQYHRSFCSPLACHDHSRRTQVGSGTRVMHERGTKT